MAFPCRAARSSELIGARFVGHPPYTKLRVISREPRNSILEGIEDFEIEDEPYRFEFCGLKDSEIIMEYEHEGSTFPAGWMRKLGAGRMVYLMPGHNLNSFKNQAYRQLISRSADYLLRL